jgi:hypothetical protein
MFVYGWDYHTYGIDHRCYRYCSLPHAPAQTRTKTFPRCRDRDDWVSLRPVSCRTVNVSLNLKRLASHVVQSIERGIGVVVVQCVRCRQR